MAQAPAARVLNLDLLRLVSALLVLGYHFGFRMQITGEGGGVAFPELSAAAMWLDIGVLIFFAISGYVIALSAEGRSAFDFAVGRFARLWPTFVLCTTVTAIVLYHWPVSGVATPTFKQWLAHLAMNSRLLGQPFLDGAYWTIAYEIIFYGWVFLLIAAGLFNHHWRALAVIWLSISAANEWVFGSEVLRKLFITEYSGYFVFGIALFKLRQAATLATVFVLLCAAAWATITPIIVEAKGFAIYGVRRDSFGVAMLGPIAMSSVAVCSLAPSLRIRPTLAMALGGLTYPLYLLHQNIGYAAFAQFGAEYGRWLVGATLIALMMLTSWLIAAIFEPTARRAIVRLAAHLQSLVASTPMFGRIVRRA